MNNTDALYLPNKDELKKAYDLYTPAMTAVLLGIEHKIKQTLTLPSVPTFKARVKDFSSYYRKLLRVRPPSLGKQDLPVITDMMGIRLICAFLEDLGSVEKQITENFNVVEIERKGADRTFQQFGYESTHILISIPEKFLTTYELPAGILCEIQIRTILQDAWAEVEHELVYKSEFSPFDLPLKRKLASMNASLSLADIIFQEIRDYQNKLNHEMDHRRNAFYEKADKLSLLKAEDNFDIKDLDQVEFLASPSPYVHGTIDDLLLEAIHAHNNGQIDTAILIYTQIINSKPPPNSIVLSVIFKHRGMAYFAQNQYDKSLEDFFLSTQHDPKSFRSYYYIGIVYSVLDDEHKAIEYFNQSLKLNHYQSHVYYRLALSLYHLADYSASLLNLDKAKDLGLNNDDSIKLRLNLVKKLEMN